MPNRRVRTRDAHVTLYVRLAYPHEYKVICIFVDGKLRGIGENDCNAKGLNLMDALSDNTCAHIVDPSGGDIR